jgi:FmdE protein associated with molybdenum formylmethanofuran dehydrogenase
MKRISRVFFSGFLTCLTYQMLLTATWSTAHAETPAEWITLGTRVHGAFGSFLPVGIRIGLDALARLDAKPREVTVLYYDSDKAPCACVADGVAMATVATVGQRTLEISPQKAPAGALAVVVVRSKTTGKAVKYAVPESWIGGLIEINRNYDPAGRYDEVMKANGLFEVTPEP